MDKERRRKIKKKSTGTLDMLGLIFITLKLIGVITWNWWWVLAPFWVEIALIAGLVIISELKDNASLL